MNKYNDPELFERYMQLHRSKSGVEASDEWPVYKKLLPDFKNKRVLDLGCGPGLHSEYAAANGASKVLGIDLSSRMIERAQANSMFPNVQYQVGSISDIDYPANSFDTVISAMAFHYVPSYEDIVRQVQKCLVEGGEFVFSTTNPIFTASGNADWHRDEQSHSLHWRVDNYFREGRLIGDFLGEDVYMYHRTLGTMINTLLDHGFRIVRVVEPEPEKREYTMDFSHELESRRPRFIVISAQKIK